MKKFWAEFKKFIAKGNVVDLAIAVVIGSAFNKIVSSLVNDVIMPLISFAVGGADVSDWKWVITPAEYDASGNVLVAESALRYGSFIQTIIDFLIIALTLFIMFKIFTYSKNKLTQFGENIVHEAQALKEKAKKKKKKKGEVVEESVEATTETKVEETKIEEPKVVEEAKVEEAKIETTDDANTKDKTSTTRDDLMISLLQDIRDSLKSQQTK